MKTALLALAAAGLIVSGAVSAQSGAELFKAKGCANCHDPTAKRVGPSNQDIAAKHKASKGAVDQLAEKLQQGKGHMKIVASEPEIKAMVSYMLGTGK